MMRACLILAATVALCAADSSASAQGYGGAGFGLGKRGLVGGFGFGQTTTIFDLYRTGQIPTPPYFALNPPVYYSYPVPRTYGYSPWPYPGDVRTPDLFSHVEPLEIVNPYVPSSTTKPAPKPEETVKSKTATPQPLVIHNPFVTDQPAVVQVSH